MNGKLRIQNELKSRIEVNCNLCGHDKGWTVYEKDGVIDDHKIWCEKCGLIYKKFIWSEEDNNKFYNEYYLNFYMGWTNDGANGRKTHFEYGKRRRNQIDKVKDLLKDANRPMEFGCSSGGVLSELVKINKNFIGIDIDDESIAFAINAGLPAKKLDLFKMDKKFDLIWSSHVFEHLTNVKPFIERLDGVLKKDGKIILLVPDSIKMLEGPHVPHVFNFSNSTFRAIIEQNSSLRMTKKIEDDSDIFMVFEKNKKIKPFKCKTSFEKYESHVKKLRENLIWGLRQSYEKSTQREERKILSQLYKEFGRVSFSQKLLWSKFYRFFTFKWMFSN